MALSALWNFALKMFAEGARQETIGETLQFHIVRYISAEDNSARFARWVAGPLWFPYKWEEIQPNFEIVV